jgi:hypothetical protein
MIRMARRRQSARMRKHAVGARRPEAVVDPFRAGPTKAELRARAAEAVASYSGPITRCAPKRRRSA